ncbi:MAG: hypothetical protein PUC10_08420, partial [Clostridiales bacterium]|nr:hypothetical protein [Clostridiales bacterium]
MKRVITIVLAMAMALSVCSVAYAGDKINIVSESKRFKEIDGNVNVSVSINNTTPNDAYLRVIQPNDTYTGNNAVLSASFTPDVDKSYIKIPSGESPIQFTVKVDPSISEECSVTLLFNYYDGTDGKSQVASCQYNFTIERTSPTSGNTGEGGSAGENPDNAQTEEPKKEDSEFRIRTSSVDSNGVCVLTPSGDYGDQL